MTFTVHAENSLAHIASVVLALNSLNELCKSGNMATVHDKHNLHVVIYHQFNVHMYMSFSHRHSNICILCFHFTSTVQQN